MNTPPTILLIGKNGQVGRELHRLTIAPLGDLIAVDRDEMDLAEPDSIRRVKREIKPVLIINAAACTALDKAEEELELALAVNGIAPRVIAEEANRIGGAIVNYSTDYALDGTKDALYMKEDTPFPIDIYGKTKHGEEAVQSVCGAYLILWTSWVYSLQGENFLNTILQFRQERNEHRVTEDQIGSSTWSRIIAETTAQAPAQLRLPARGAWTEDVSVICNLIAHGATSWFGFAAAIVAEGFLDENTWPKLTPIGTTEYPTLKARPKNSRLSVNRLDMHFGIKVSEWSQSVKLCLQELEQQAGVTV